jgi:excisionase family DNA binding protein
MSPERSSHNASTGSCGASSKPHEALRDERAGIAPERATTVFGESLVDAAAVAAYLAVDTSTVYRLAQTGAIPGIEIAPRVLRFRAADVREYVERRTRRPAAPGRVKHLLGTGRE